MAHKLWSTGGNQPVFWNNTRGRCHALTDTDVARHLHCRCPPGLSCRSSECSARSRIHGRGRRGPGRPPAITWLAFSGDQCGCSHRLECECRQGRSGRVPSSHEQPAPRIAALCRHARGHPRRAERDQPSLSSLRLQDWSEARSLSRCCRGCGGARRAGPTPPATPSALLGLRRRERRGRDGRCGLRSRAWGNPGRSSQAAGCRPGTRRRRGYPGPEGRGRIGNTTVRHGIPAGHAAWRVPLHTWVRLRVRAGLGRCHSLCAERQLTVPPRSAVRGDREEVHGGLQ
jgi:hypothetical protein